MRYRKGKNRNVSGAPKRKFRFHPSPYLIWGAITVLVVPIAIILAVHLPPIQKEVIRRVVARIENDTSVKVQLRSYRWWPFSRLRVYDLKVQSGGKDVLECGQAQLAYRLSLGWPYFVPKELTLDRPVIRLEKDSKGQWRFPKTPSPPGGGETVAAGSRWLKFPWPPVRIQSGVILAEQNGRLILNIREVSGALSFRTEDGAGGPVLKVKLGDWGGRVDLPQWGAWHVSGDFELHERSILVSSLIVQGGEKGQIASRGAWGLDPPHDGEGGIDVVSLRLTEFPEIRAAAPRLQVISGHLGIKSERGVWSLDHDVESNLGSLKGSATIKLPVDGYKTAHWTTHFSDMQMSALPSVRDARLSGTLELTAGGQTLEELSARLSSRLESSRCGDFTIDSGDIEASYDKGTLSVQRAEIKSSLGAFSLAGNADLEGLWDPLHRGEAKGDFKVEEGRPGALLPGSGEHMSGSARVEAQYGAGEFRNWEKWQGKADLQLNVPELVSVKASGEYKRAVLDLEYDLEAKDLARVSVFLPSWQGKGRLSSKGKLKGGWADLVWDGAVTLPEFEYGPVRTEQASLTGKGGVIGMRGNRKLTFTAQTLVAAGTKLDAVQLDAEQREDGCSFKLKGGQPWNRLTTTLSGRLDNIFAPPRKLTIAQGQVAWKDQKSLLEAKLDIQNDRIHVESLNIQQGAQKIHLGGDLALEAGSHLKVDVENVNTGQWLAALGLENLVAGSASGEIEVGGRVERPEMALSLLLTNGFLQVQQERENKGRKSVVTLKEPIGTLRLKGQYAGEALQIQGELKNQAERIPIQVSAKIPMRLTLLPFNLEILKNVEWNSALKLTDLDAQEILPYIPVLDQAGGLFLAEGRGSGTLSQPVVKTSGTYRDGHFRVTEWPHPVENIYAEWTADAANIYVNESKMRLLGGDVRVKGHIDYPHFDFMEWNAEGENLEVPEIFGIGGKVSGHARLIQDPDKADLTGELLFSKATLNLGEFENNLARSIDIVEGEGKGDLLFIKGDEKQQRNYYNRLKMEVALKLPPSGTWVRGKGLEAEITGEVKMMKDRHEPLRFFGRFQTQRGTYTFQGNQLDIRDGEMVFSGLPDPDPNLRIVCQKQVRDVSVQVQVTGPVSQPKMVLSSIPAMNQVDVLSYLLFGHPATELGSKESNQLQNSAASWLGSQTSSVIKGMFGNSKFAPDSVVYRGATSKQDHTANNNTQGGVIEIGKQVTPDLYVTYQQGVMGENENQVQVEYRFNRHVSVQTQVGNGDQSGVDVFWRYDFGK